MPDQLICATCGHREDIHNVSFHGDGPNISNMCASCLMDGGGNPGRSRCQGYVAGG